MAVHSFHIFDRKGKTLYTKRYSKKKNTTTTSTHKDETSEEDTELISEQRKLIFGMLFSLRELVGSLIPDDAPQKGLHSIRTGASTLHNYETLSGLRFALYTSNDTYTDKKSVSSSSSSSSSSKKNTGGTSVREALQFIYSELWVDCVIRSPLYRVGGIGEGSSGNSSFDIQSTNFEKKLEDYFASMSWFK